MTTNDGRTAAAQEAPGSPPQTAQAAEQSAAEEKPSPVSDELRAAIDEELEDLEDDENGPRRRRGGSVLISIVCILLALFIAFSFRGEIAFWLTAPSAPAPLDAADLGASGQLERLVGGHVSVRGTPGKSYARFKRHFTQHELVALNGTPLIVQRAPTGASESQPADRRPTEASGRLVREDMLPREYRTAFEVFLRRGEASLQSGHLYVLMQEETPRRGALVPLILLTVIVMLAANVVHLARALKARRRDESAENNALEAEGKSGGQESSSS